jgi:hypothetical protein
MDTHIGVPTGSALSASQTQPHSDSRKLTVKASSISTPGATLLLCRVKDPRAHSYLWALREVHSSIGLTTGSLHILLQRLNEYS